MGPWAHNLWDERDYTDRDEWHLQIECSPNRILYFHGTQLEGPDFTTLESKVTFALRQVCHLLVDHIDNKGLQEVCQSLAEFFEYYRPTDGSPGLLSGTSSRDATVGERSIRHPFAIEGD